MVSHPLSTIHTQLVLGKQPRPFITTSKARDRKIISIQCYSFFKTYGTPFIDLNKYSPILITPYHIEQKATPRITMNNSFIPVTGSTEILRVIFFRAMLFKPFPFWHHKKKLMLHIPPLTPYIAANSLNIATSEKKSHTIQATHQTHFSLCTYCMTPAQPNI